MMTPAGLQRALIDLGWIALTRRALGLRPAEAHALRQLMRRPGMPLTYAQMAAEYPGATGSADGIKKRVERVRAGLHAIGCSCAVETVNPGGYVVHERDALRIERAILFACGVRTEPEHEAP